MGRTYGNNDQVLKALNYSMDRIHGTLLKYIVWSNVNHYGERHDEHVIEWLKHQRKLLGVVICERMHDAREFPLSPACPTHIRACIAYYHISKNIEKIGNMSRPERIHKPVVVKHRRRVDWIFQQSRGNSLGFFSSLGEIHLDFLAVYGKFNGKKIGEKDTSVPLSPLESYSFM